MVKSKNPIKSTAISARPPGPQAIPSSVGESPDSLNLISRSSSRAGKRVHPRGRSGMHNTVRRSSRSVSAGEDSRQISPEPFSSSEEEESSKEEADLDPKTPATSRVLADKLSHRIVPLQLPAVPSPFAPEGRNDSMSWDGQVATKESRNSASGASAVPQASLPAGLMPYGPNHGTAESSTQLGGGSARSGPCDVTGDCDRLVTHDCDNLPKISQPMTSSGVTSDITHDHDFWDSDHHITSLSRNIGHLDNDTKVLASSILRIARFIQKYSIGSQPLEQFPPILGAGSIMWILFQAISEAGWDCFKISPHPNALSLVKAMRTVYGPSPPHELSLDVEMAVDEPVVEETPFIAVTNKKCKAKGKVPSAANSPSSQNVPPATPVVVSRTPPLRPQPAKMAAAKPTTAKVATNPQAPKVVSKSFAQVAHSGNTQPTPRFAPASAHPEYESLLRLCDMFLDLPLEKVLAMY